MYNVLSRKFRLGAVHQGTGYNDVSSFVDIPLQEHFREVSFDLNSLLSKFGDSLTKHQRQLLNSLSLKRKIDVCNLRGPTSWCT